MPKIRNHYAARFVQICVATFVLALALPPALDTPSLRLSTRSGEGASDAATSVEQLMVDYVQGNEQAFDELYRLLSPKLFGYLLRLTRHRERAEDLLQVTFSKLHRARTSYLPDAPLLPWVLAIARRSFYDDARSLKTRREELSADGTLPEPPANGADPVDELTNTLERALAELPEAYREVIVLTKLTGLSVAEAAAVVGATPSAVKLRVHRGYKVLREVLERIDSDV